MKKPDPLFQLIKSMSKAEKRYFKLNRSRHQVKGGKDYLRLFDAIEAQDNYNEKAIREKFKGEPYFKQLGFVKSYLQKQILKSLRGFYDDSSYVIKLNNYLTEIQILYKKELFANCTITIKKALALALKYENWIYVLKISEWEIGIADRTGNFGQPGLQAKEFGLRTAENIDKYRETMTLKTLFLETAPLIYKVGINGTPKEAVDFDKVIKHPLIQKEASTFEGNRARLNIRLQYAEVCGDNEAAHREIRNAISLYDLHPHQIPENLNSYIHYKIGVVVSLINSKKFTAANRLMMEMKNTYEKKYGELSIRNNLKLLQLETYLLLQKGEFKETLSLLPQISALTENNYKEMDPATELFDYIFFADVYFRNNNFKKAQFYIQKIINYGSNARLDIQSSARLVNLMLQYEQGEYEHMGYILRSAYRYLKQKQKLDKPESIILDFMRKAVKFANEKEVLPALSELKQQLTHFADIPFIANFPFMEWIDSKLQKKTLAEIMEKNYLAAIAKEEAEVKIAV